MQRRDFINNTCRFCLISTAAVITGGIAACSAAATKNIFKPEVDNNTILVPLSLFDVATLQVISPKKFQYEIAIQKTSANTYKALLLRCTHYDNQLTPTGNGYSCSLHGSRFSKDGTVLNGPATSPLLELKTQVVNKNLLIHL